jgi:hypothetical protein
MSRKTKLSTVAQKLPKQKPLRVKQYPTSFSTKKLRLPKPSMRQDRHKGTELLEKELEKPFNKRNKAL